MERQELRFVLLVVCCGLVLPVISAAPDCSPQIVQMSSCLKFVTGGTDPPSTSCCSALADVVSKYPVCLCELVDSGNSSLSTGLPIINSTLARLLPKICSVLTDESQCPGLLGETSPQSPSTGTPPAGTLQTGTQSPVSEPATPGQASVHVPSSLVLAIAISFVSFVYSHS